uniref:Pupal cuticle protein Edg-84A n=2 Tax=Drosophila melanogaster TaxID=7227 RepID=CUP8_DROME|nr:Ecdysone-dependent gene 84A [Drosophila melanogaster]P27780.1 RecName: Full=Pupal cuticle protein Edg-84A; Flags: Precursor [Drosophila melanogaster]AAA28501.1 cuticle protein [Drosophila melanogaster]AAD19810.1 pupal-cuticle-protein [Drosophila melanogaster]AAF54097.2 Ecdysone-dependent gene 84A [Drosophila melanogaster]|eukprot:NP_524247.1 Ecdysone-dependent gene 84A [Drosophila melanogaster]
MLVKTALFVTLIGLAQAGPLPAKSSGSEDTYDSHPQYSFNYDVQDPETGDVKSQSESRDGDVVHGQYSVNDADGYRRTVDYTADDVRGFNAVVRREPLSSAAVVVKPQATAVVPKVQLKPLKKLPALKPLSQASAVVHRSFAPVVHHAPVTHVVHHAAPAHSFVSHHVPVLKTTVHHAHHPHAISYVF